MADPLTIPLSDLIADSENPRLPTRNLDQEHIIRAIASHQGRKLVELAQHIIDNGLNPTDPLFIMESLDNRYVVLEGNRRLATLRILEKPDILKGDVDKNIEDAFLAKSVAYRTNPIEEVSCVLFEDRDEAYRWIVLKHGGEQKGVGTVPWGSQEKSRFAAQSIESPTEIALLDYLEKNGFLTPDERQVVPLTSWQRLIRSPDVREKLGITIENKRVKRLAEEDEVGAALAYVALELANGDIRTGDIYTKKDRIRYAKNLPQDIVVTPTLKKGIVLQTVAKTKEKSKKAQTPKKPQQRIRLIPDDCVLKVTNPRIANVEEELRDLNVNYYPNAISVLFRVFIELSVDAYIECTKLNVKDGARLKHKMNEVVRHMVDSGALTKQQAAPVRKAAQGKSWLTPSTHLFNEYVHNAYMSPEPNDLRAAWDNLQPFITVMWSP